MPTINDYDDAIRAGKVRFKDKTLRDATPEINKRPVKGGFIEEPWRAPGSFAVAYKMKMSDGRLRAIRCYFAENAQHSQRYRVLHTELPAKLKDYTVDFRYLDQGIRVDGSPSAPYLPVVDMEWVQGRELRQYVAHIADNNDVARLKALAEAWLALMERMRAAQIAHGDLSGNNIMVRDNGALVLIDYDGMYTPTLANLPSNEAGAPEYQHPTAQDKRKYGPDMDRFSALLIYIVLRALQERPSLWKQHSEYSGAGLTNLASDRMLFKIEDLKAPATSPLFRELSALRDPLTLKLVEALKRACVEDITRTPWVGELADPDHAQKIALATLKAAIDADDDRAIMAADAPALRSYAPARVYDTRVAAAKANLSALPTLQQALNAGDDDDKIVALWEKMRESATTRPFKPQVEAARKRATLAKELRQAIRDDDYPGILHIEAQLKGTQTLKPYERAIKEVWVRYSRIEVIGRALDKGNDELAVRVWDLAIKDPKLEKRMEPYKARVEQARARLNAIPAARAAVAARDDELLIKLWAEISAKPAAQDLAAEALASRGRIEALPQLKKALDEDRVEDATRLWERYQLQGRRIAQPYEARYQEARKRWLERLDPRDVSVAFRGANLFIRWEWPETITTVVVAVDTLAFPASPRPADPRCSRQEYDRLGGYLLTPPQGERYYVRLFSQVLENGVWQSSLGAHPSASVSIARERTIYYEIVRSPDGAVLKIRSADTSPLPNLVVCAQTDEQLNSPEGAQMVARIDERSADARQGQVSVPLDFSSMTPGKKAYVRVFPAEHDPGIRAIGQPTDNLECESA